MTGWRHGPAVVVAAIMACGGAHVGRVGVPQKHIAGAANKPLAADTHDSTAVEAQRPGEGSAPDDRKVHQSVSFKEIHNFDYVVLLCRNIAKTRTFYQEVMGFPLEHDSDGWVSFRVGSTLLTLRPRGPSVAWNDGPATPGSASVQLAFRVPPPAVDAWHAELVERAVPIVRPPTDLPSWRHRTLFFRDPEDNVIEIYAEY